MRGRLLLPLGFPIVFAAGWLGGAHTRPVESAVREEPHVVEANPAAAAPAASCVDPAAMEANANLVAQLQDSKARLHDAQRTASSAAAKVIEAEAAPPSYLVVAKDEWTRMGKEGMFRLRTPCATWDGSGRSQMITGRRTRTSVTGRGGAASMRIAAAGFTAEELPTLEQVYSRVNRRSWKKMQATCERSESYREFVAEYPPENDAQRVDNCRSLVIGRGDELRPTIQRVAELLAGGAAMDRATGDADRILLAAAQSSEELWNELASTFGREKARRAAESGVACVDEVVYDVREPKDGPPS